LGEGVADGRGPPGMVAATVAPTRAARAQDAGWGGWATATPIQPKAGGEAVQAATGSRLGRG
jgi:hypothetical protein